VTTASSPGLKRTGSGLNGLFAVCTWCEWYVCPLQCIFSLRQHVLLGVLKYALRPVRVRMPADLQKSGKSWSEMHTVAVLSGKNRAAYQPNPPAGIMLSRPESGSINN